MNRKTLREGEIRPQDFYLLKMNSHHKEDFRNKYKLIKKIGLGNFTAVYKAENKKKRIKSSKNNKFRRH